MEKLELIKSLKAEIGRRFQRSEKFQWSYAEESGLADLALRADIDAELVLVMNAYDTKRPCLPHSIARLVETWGKVLDEIRFVAGLPKTTTERPQRPASVWELKQKMELLQKDADNLKARYASETGLGIEWSDSAKKSLWRGVMQEIRALESKIKTQKM